MFSGIWSLSGTETKVPCLVSEFQVNHSYTLLFAANASSIATKDLDFSLTAITSPGCNEYEGTFKISPFTVICLWEKSLNL